jgi:type III restriction enzyme
LFALRYSATHRNPYNVVYRLSPFEAYRQGLVKRIEVASVVQSDDENKPFLRLDAIRTQKRTLTARIALHKLMRNGTVKERVVTVRPGDRLEEKAGRPEYGPYAVDEIDAALGVVRFANGEELRLGETKGTDKEAIFAAQIQYTVEEHFRRQARLRGQGIKVLSLFFIDRVDNYAHEQGLIRRLFREAFEEARARHPEWDGTDVDAVQAAYFAQRRTRAGEVVLEDTKTGEAERDRQAYELIMQDKERLLSFDEPTCFIFSHSALREGWDNPNVFQICTLNQTASEMRKRQEVGRGVRLAVNQDGDRVHEERVNVLTVVANESYERYVGTLQSEIEAEYGTEGLPPKPANARKRRTARLRKEYTLRPEFKELWERIKHKTRYAVRIDSSRLVEEVVAELDRTTISPPRVVFTKAQVAVEAGDAFTAVQTTATRTALEVRGRYEAPNLVQLMSHLLEHTTPPVRLTRRTLLEIFRRTRQKQAALDNPHGFATEAVRIIKEKLADQLVDGIQYERINEWYEMSQFDAEIESWEQYLVPAERSVYDHVVWDSEVERRFAEELDRRDDVRLFLKLPSWFTVPTPIGEYNPDWAIVMEERDEHGEPTGRPLLYLVRETKDTTDRSRLRPDERRKIECGERHFRGALGVDYEVVTSAGELP